jgi:hypothetical protein
VVLRRKKFGLLKKKNLVKTVKEQKKPKIVCHEIEPNNIFMKPMFINAEK